MGLISYNGYYGWHEYDPDADICHGEVLLLRDIVTFVGRTTDELKQALADSIDIYLEDCAERGEEPDKPVNGSLNVMLDPRAFQRMAAEAASKGVGMNDLAADILTKAADGFSF